MSFVVPLVEGLQGVLKRRTGGHALRLFVGDILRDGSVDVNEVILDSFWKLRRCIEPVFVVGRRRSCDEDVMRLAKILAASMPT